MQLKTIHICTLINFFLIKHLTIIFFQIEKENKYLLLLKQKLFHTIHRNKKFIQNFPMIILFFFFNFLRY